METLARKVKKINATIYQRIAKKFDTSTLYVGQIARGERQPITTDPYHKNGEMGTIILIEEQEGEENTIVSLSFEDGSIGMYYIDCIEIINNRL